jgi:hypothetical protein
MTRTQLLAKLRGRLAEREVLAETMTGTATVAIGVNDDPTAVLGTGTLFTEEFSTGQEIKLEGEIREVAAISSDTELLVHREFDSAHVAAAVQRLAVRTWSDDHLLGKLEDALREFNDLCWSAAPRLLDATYLAAVVANATTVVLPSGLRTLRLLEIKTSTTAPYQALSPRALPALRSNVAAPWYLPSSNQNRGAGWPRCYSFRDAATIELDSAPPAAVADGWRLSGPGTIAPWADATSGLLAPGSSTAPLADLASVEAVLVDWAAADAVLDDETQNPARATALRAKGDRRAQGLLSQWSVGRRAGTRQVRIISR